MQSWVIIKNQNQINNIRESGKYLNEILELTRQASKAWTSLIELENLAENYIKKHNLKWAFKWYEWFPANLCLSVNDCVVHGIPDKYVLKNWDLLKIDCGVNYNKWISDAAVSLVVWWELANPLGQALIVATKSALDRSLEYIYNGNSAYEYSRNVLTIMKNAWFSVLEKLTGHGVWNYVHEQPHIYNVPDASMKKVQLKTWMIIALEPITAIKSRDFYNKNNDRNLYTEYGDLWAQWEYTVLVTDNGYEILAGLKEFN